ncbi:MAG TPA: hypothetical protein DCQ06_04730 [Myxococcales bacterium]|nr:hypothetical protein [Myxococcales bacterium]HAN30880.1 hypothetical protein [Myxococcales bacterium]
MMSHNHRYCMSVNECALRHRTRLLTPLLLTLGLFISVPALATTQSVPSTGAAPGETKDADDLDTRSEFRFTLEQLRTGQYRRAHRRLDKLRPTLKSPQRQQAADALIAYADDLERLYPSHSLTFKSQPAGRKQVIALLTGLSMYNVGALAVSFQWNPLGASLLVGLAGVGGFWGGLRLTERIHIPDAQASAMTYGTFLLGVTTILGVDADLETSLLYSGSALLGAGLGWLGANYLQPSPGQMSFISQVTLMGFGTSIGLAFAFPDSVFNEAQRLSMNVAMWVGAAASLATAKWVDWSLTRVRYVSLSSGLGVLLGLAAQTLIKIDDQAGYARNGTIGLWAGFALGIALTDTLPESPYFKDDKVSASLTPATIPDSVGQGAPGFALSGRF